MSTVECSSTSKSTQEWVAGILYITGGERLCPMFFASEALNESFGRPTSACQHWIDQFVHSSQLPWLSMSISFLIASLLSETGRDTVAYKLVGEQWQLYRCTICGLETKFDLFLTSMLIQRFIFIAIGAVAVVLLLLCGCWPRRLWLSFIHTTKPTTSILHTYIGV